MNMIRVWMQRTGWGNERKPLGLSYPAVADVDHRAVVAGDALRVLAVIDVRHGLQLPVEDNRKVLRIRRAVRTFLSAVAAERSALRFGAGDVVKLLLTLARELQSDDRLSRVRIEVRASSRE